MPNTKIAIGVALLASLVTGRAQDSKLNTNLGGGVSVPLNPTAQFAGVGGHFVVGAGYNFNKYNSLVGEFMWSSLPSTRFAVLPNLGVGRSSNLYTVTGNYMARAQGRRFGAYFIGGGGLYFRHSALEKKGIERGIVCAPNWLWWGYSCEEGFISTDRTLISTGSSAFGGNAGVGFTIKIADSGEKFYVESRYHYAPNRNIPTTLTVVTFGFRY